MIAVAAAAVGFLLGSLLPEPEVKRMSRALDHYENYLAQTENAAHQKARSVSISRDESPDIDIRKDHTEKLLAAREAQQSQDSSRSV